MAVLHLDPSESLVVVVDVQERLFGAMPELAGNDLVRAGSVLLDGAALLGVPVIATEQNPDKLGGTLAALSERLDAMKAARFSKLDFSACREPAFAKALAEADRRKIVLVGMETHICVFQTARDLCERGFTVHVPMDGVASRRDDHRRAGLDLIREAGGTITTAETILFDWLGRAGSDEFRKISKLIK